MLADFDPGEVTALFVVCGAGLVAALCLLLGVVVLCFKKREAFLGWLAAAVSFVLLGILLAVLAVVFGKRFNLL
jgi:hypothetical protein